MTAQSIKVEMALPEPLPDGLPPVPAFDPELLTKPLRARVQDIADRMQCPPDYVAAAMLVMLSGLIGRRVGIQPKERDDWTVVPNLWGAIVGGPGVLKTPALNEALKPIRLLQAKAAKFHEQEMADFKAARMLRDESEKVAKDAIRRLLKEGKTALAEQKARDVHDTEDDEPSERRYVVNDSTVEKLGEILNENQSGLLLYRDELAGFFRNLEKQGREGDRAFYLEAWNGDGHFTYDRIGRGTLHIHGCCLAILGSIQPGPLGDIVRRTVGAGDDGLLQRFQLTVWPDQLRTWRNVDRTPDQDAKAEVQEIIERLDRIDAMRVDADPGDIPVLRFAPDAQALFNAWREPLERRLRAGTLHPLMEAHLAKYRSLVPSIALVLHLTIADTGPVSLEATERAIGWAEYLEPHARRVYAPGISPDMDAARALAQHIEAGDLPPAFTARDVYRRGWSGISTKADTEAALEILEDFNWLSSQSVETGGKPRVDYHINPALLKEDGS